LLPGRQGTGLIGEKGLVAGPKPMQGKLFNIIDQDRAGERG